MRINGSKDSIDLVQEKQDPYLIEICRLRERSFELEERIKRLEEEKNENENL